MDLFAAKLRPPPRRPGTVPRSPLIERLTRDEAHSIVVVDAPSGYGKTTLLSQWAERNGQVFAWVSVDDADNNPKVLLSYIAAALDAVEPIDRRVFDALSSPASSIPSSVVPGLGSAFSSMSSRVALVLDNVHVLRNRECHTVVSVLADHVPGGSRLVLSGRSRPPLQVARLRAEGRLLEIGPAELSLTREEAGSLLRNTDLSLVPAEVATLHLRTEGWPAGLYLAALYLQEAGSLPHSVVTFRGHDRLIREYLESEFLAQLPEPQRVFLTRTAILTRMCGPLCEAVLGVPAPASALTELARSNMLLVPLDRRGEWYRYHRLFREMLLAELHRTEPGLVPVLQRRAADWCQRNGQAVEALEYSMAAHDVDTAAGVLMDRLCFPALWRGRVTTLRRWLRCLEQHGGTEAHPRAAVAAALVAMLTGRPDEAERQAEVVDRWRSADTARPDGPSAEALAALLRAMLCRSGIAQMRADADEAARRWTAMGPMIPAIPLMQGLARIISGDLDGGAAYLEDAASLGEEGGLPEFFPVTLCEQALVAMARDDYDRAEDLVNGAAAVLWRSRPKESLVAPLVCAVRARIAVLRGDASAVRQELISAQRLRPLLTYALPHIAVQARIVLLDASLAVADLAGAHTLLREIDELLRRRPGLGTLASRAQALRAQVSAQRGPARPEGPALTFAELRLLPLLSTHLSIPEVAEELSLSRNTIRSQAYSLYHKLGASSRSQAVTRARELALLEG